MRYEVKVQFPQQLANNEGSGLQCSVAFPLCLSLLHHWNIANEPFGCCWPPNSPAHQSPTAHERPTGTASLQIPKLRWSTVLLVPSTFHHFEVSFWPNNISPEDLFSLTGVIFEKKEWQWQDCLWLDLMILQVFFNLNDSMIPLQYLLYQAYPLNTLYPGIY